ncbi:MAG: YraN family protein [Limnobacter sp.]|nr:YraN family protein [Limnobacter sp.]
MKKKTETSLSSIPWPVRTREDQKTRVPWSSVSKPKPYLQEVAKKADNRLEMGHRAEQLACDFLSEEGYKCIERNFRARVGEIDLIMAKGDLAVVVEVRQRSHSHFGGGLASVNHRKQTKIRRCAALWWQLKGRYQFKALRFDVISLDRQLNVQWVRDAFNYSHDPL